MSGSGTYRDIDFTAAPISGEAIKKGVTTYGGAAKAGFALFTRGDGYLDPSIHPPGGLLGGSLEPGTHLASLPNGNFQDGLINWTQSYGGGGAVAIDPTNSLSGTNALKLTTTAAADFAGVFSMPIPIAGGVPLLVSVMAETISGSSNLNVNATYYKADGKTQVGSAAAIASFAPSAVYRETRGSILPPLSARYVVYTVSSTGAAGVIEVDELRHDAINKLGLPPINVGAAPYNIVPDNATDFTAALQQVFNDAMAQGRSVYFPGAANPYTLAGTITLNSPVSFFGDDEQKTILRSLRNNGPMFTLAVNTTTWEGMHVRNIRFDAYFQSGDTYNSSVAFLVTGDGTAYLQHCRFESLTAAGFYDGLIRVTKNTHNTGVLNEALVCWNLFQDIRITGFSNPAIRGFYFTLGSGTGNHWNGLTGSPQAHYLFFDGANACVGDIVVTACHFGGINNTTAIIKVGDNTTYRNNISVTASQVDAGAALPFDLSTIGSTEYSNIKYNGNNTGGGANTTNTPPIRGGKFESRGASSWEMGKLISIPQGGQQTFNLFSVALAYCELVKVDLVIGGLVAGVAAGGGLETWILRHDGSAPGAQQVAKYQNPSPPAYTIQANVSGQTIYFTLTVSPTQPGSFIDAQMVTRGGKHSAWIL